MYWKEGVTKKGEKKLTTLRNKKWLTVVIYPNDRLFIIYDNKIIKNKLKYSEIHSNDELYELINAILEDKGLQSCTSTELKDKPKAWEDMKPNEQLVEIGIRETIKYFNQMKVDKFGDGYEN